MRTDAVPPPHLIPLAIALLSLIVIPLCVALWRHYREAYRAAKKAELTEILSRYVKREELEMQFSELNRVQQERHQQHAEILQEIREEALQREGRVLGKIDSLRQDSALENRGIRDEVRGVNGRVDNVLQLLGDRRRP